VRNFEIPLEFFNQNQIQSFQIFCQKSFFSKNIFKIIQIARFFCCLGFGFILGYSYIFFNFFEEHFHSKNSIFHFAPCFKQPLFPLPPKTPAFFTLTSASQRCCNPEFRVSFFTFISGIKWKSILHSKNVIS
jgi:hypothetical protein